MSKIREAEILQAAAVAVAAPRYMGAFASAMGLILLEHWPWFADVEIITGAAMALLEGWAIAFIFRNWRRVRVGSTHWKVLLTLQIILLLMLPATATPYLVSSQLGLPAIEILPTWLVWLWSFAVAAIAPLVVAAVGYADVGEPALASKKPKVEPATSETEPIASEPIAESVSFACTYCPATFSSQSALNAHQRAHAGKIGNGTSKIAELIQP